MPSVFDKFSILTGTENIAFVRVNDQDLSATQTSEKRELEKLRMFALAAGNNNFMLKDNNTTKMNSKND